MIAKCALNALSGANVTLPSRSVVLVLIGRVQTRAVLAEHFCAEGAEYAKIAFILICFACRPHGVPRRPMELLQ
jgi:hypothetical protein